MARKVVHLSKPLRPPKGHWLIMYTEKPSPIFFVNSADRFDRYNSLPSVEIIGTVPTRKLAVITCKSLNDQIPAVVAARQEYLKKWRKKLEN